MNLSIIDKKIDEPFYFHREYKNDIHQTEQQGNEEASASWLQLSQRIAFASLPFFSLYKPFSMPIALVMGSVRVYSSASELYSLIQEGDTQKISKGVIQTAIAVTALAGTILAHPIGMLVTTGQDIVIDCGYVIHHLNEGDYKKAAERTASLVNNALYLSLFVAGSLELSIASVTVQVLLGAYNSSEDFQKGRWIEGSAHILMAAIRTNQLRGQIQALQQRNEFEQKIKDFIKQSDETKKKMQPKSSSEDIGNHVSKRIMSERVVASHSGNKMLIRNTSLQNANKDISDILIEYGNNPLKIPAINYAAHLGKEDVVKLLLQHGANANQHSMRGSPLEIALAAGHRHLVPLFLEYKVTVTANAASSCCKHHFLNELQLLMKINQSEICTSKVVTDCCEYAFLEGLELLFENGATIPSNFTNDQVLYKWLSKGETKFVPIVKFLIKRGANCQYYINASRIQIDKKHNTPSWSLFICSGGLLVPALDFDDPELIELLIKIKPRSMHM